MAVVWIAMMAVWLAALLAGVWWLWPHVERMSLTSDLVAGVVWLVLGVVAWVVAFRLGLARYGRRGRPSR